MSEKVTLKPLAIALGTTFASALAIGGANAAENPFGQAELASGYMVAENAATKTPMEHLCGSMKAGTAPRCDMKTLDTDGDGKISKEEFNTRHEKTFAEVDANGDGMLDATEHAKMLEGKCGGKAITEGKCGEGKCGAGMKK